MLKDLVIQENLDRDGYAVLETGLIEQLDVNFKLSASDFYYSLLSNSYEDNIVLQRVISEALYSFYEKYFENYRTTTESFLAKPANTTTELLLHQDWCYTDEKIYSAYNLWIPLSDVTESNGAMIFLPGSHLWFDNIRSATLPTARINSKYFMDQGAKAVPLKKGQAIIFHPAVFHGSFPNMSAQNRVVVTVNMMSDNAPFLYFQRDKDGEANVIQLDDDAFLRSLNTLAIGDVTGFPQIDTMKYNHKLISETDLIDQSIIKNKV
jgi:ectoine hydroxylase-related dioxygenase (phytanoyl-CoA dioxygenase family)